MESVNQFAKIRKWRSESTVSKKFLNRSWSAHDHCVCCGLRSVNCTELLKSYLAGGNRIINRHRQTNRNRHNWNIWQNAWPTSGVASPKIGRGKKIGGGKMLDFRQITLFCLEKRLSKHKMAIFSKNLEGHGHFGPPPATPMPTFFKESHMFFYLCSKKTNTLHLYCMCGDIKTLKHNVRTTLQLLAYQDCKNSHTRAKHVK